MDVEVIAVLIPIVSMLVFGVVIIAFFYFRHRSRTVMQETIQQALDKGADLTPELLERLAGPEHNPDADLRKGLIWGAIGLACICFGILIPEEEAQGAMAGIGMFPLLIGAAYFIMWKLRGNEQRGA